MSNALTTKFTTADKKIAATLLVCTFAFVALIVGQDFLRAYLNGSAFYFSESFMFSTFWWLFAPLLFAQYNLINRIQLRHIGIRIALIISPFLIHLFAFPFVVWLISKIVYYHTYAFLQTLTYAFSEHVYLLIGIYSIPLLAYQYFYEKTTQEIIGKQLQSVVGPEINTILVTEGGKKLTIPVQEILYFSAASPYISIHTEGKKYLYNESLKSITSKLNKEQFVRVHKSTLVNIDMVASYSSRLNGDYDLVMKNKVKLRVSRNFAADFKQRFQQSHHLT